MSKEVDFVALKDESIVPIESKHSSKVGIRCVKGMIKFMDRYDVKRGFIITEDYEATEKLEDKIIIFVPLWKWVFGYQPHTAGVSRQLFRADVPDNQKV
ncbi:MAG: hypothetical protein ACXQTY_02695 [Candidatus Methanogasteraceae archaeon]